MIIEVENLGHILMDFFAETVPINPRVFNAKVANDIHFLKKVKKETREKMDKSILNQISSQIWISNRVLYPILYQMICTVKKISLVNIRKVK